MLTINNMLAARPWMVLVLARHRVATTTTPPVCCVCQPPTSDRRISLENYWRQTKDNFHHNLDGNFTNTINNQSKYQTKRRIYKPKTIKYDQ